jgi:hypothetical protein
MDGTDFDPDDMTDGEHRALAEFRNPAEIRRVEEGSGVRYKRVMLLSPGTWADAGSQEHVEYNADAIRASADNWVDLEAIRDTIPEWQQLANADRASRLAELEDTVMLEDAAPINFLHGPAMYGAESLDEIGEVPLESIIVDDDGRLFGDIVLDGDSPQSQTAIELVDEVLEATQDPSVDPPPVGPSVEIPADRVSQDEGVKSLEQAFFSAVGIVFGPASRPVELGEQARERAVALTGNAGNGGVVLRRDRDDGSGDGNASKPAPRHRSLMSDQFDPDAMDDEELAEVLRTMQEDMAELESALQDVDVDPQMAQQAIAQEVSMRVDADEELTEDEAQAAVIDELASATGRDADTLRAIASGEIDEVPEDVATAMTEVLDVDMDDLGSPAEDDEMDENEQEATMAELKQVKNVVGEVADHMSDIKDMLQAREEERETQVEELERRLSELENEPVKRSLTGEQDSAEFVDEDDGLDDAPATDRPLM